MFKSYVRKACASLLRDAGDSAATAAIPTGSHHGNPGCTDRCGQEFIYIYAYVCIYIYRDTLRNAR